MRSLRVHDYISDAPAHKCELYGCLLFKILFSVSAADTNANYITIFIPQRNVKTVNLVEPVANKSKLGASNATWQQQDCPGA